MRALLAAVALSTLTMPAWADDAAAPLDTREEAPETGRPWAANVPPERQAAALALFEAANVLFSDSQHTAALVKYREALEAWDHPAIRFNAAVALIQLDQPLAAFENLEAALRHGRAPFADETYDQAVTYRKLLVGQLTQLRVTCAQEGARITLDGKALFVAPGDETRWLLPGPHQLVARKTGFLTATRSLELQGGRTAHVTLAPKDLRVLAPTTTRRWATWKPWAVTAAGALVALAGVPFLIAAKRDIDAFNAAAASCPAGPGCSAAGSKAAVESRDRGQVENNVAVALFAVGGAAAATGITLLILNQPRLVPAKETTQARVVPLLGPGTFGVALDLAR